MIKSDRNEMKVILITGASSGIGKALALECAKKGHELVLLARREDLLLSLKNEIETKFKTRVFIRAADVTNELHLKKAVSEAEAFLGTRIDTVIANAGFGVAGNIEDLTVLDFEKQFEVNVYGVVKTFYATLSSLKETKGRLCLIGSTSSYLTVPGTTVYSMSKYAVRSFAEGLYAELAPYGVSVTLINPGFIDTDIRKVTNSGILPENSADMKDPVPVFLKMESGLAARKIMRAVSNRKRERAITAHSQLGILASRFFPGLVAIVFQKIAKTSK